MKFKLIACIAALALVASCTTTGTDARFDSLELVEADILFTNYDRVYLAPVTVSDEVRERIGYRPLGASDRTRPISERDISEKTADIYDDIKDAIDNEVTLVEAPGPGILMVEVVMTRLESNRPTQADLGANPGLSMSSVYSGAAAAEVTFSEDGQPLAVAEDSYFPSLNDSLPSGPVWSTVDRFSGRLARKLEDLLD